MSFLGKKSRSSAESARPSSSTVDRTEANNDSIFCASPTSVINASSSSKTFLPDSWGEEYLLPADRLAWDRLNGRGVATGGQQGRRSRNRQDSGVALPAGSMSASDSKANSVAEPDCLSGPSFSMCDDGAGNRHPRAKHEPTRLTKAPPPPDQIKQSGSAQGADPQGWEVMHKKLVEYRAELETAQRRRAATPGVDFIPSPSLLGDSPVWSTAGSGYSDFVGTGPALDQSDSREASPVREVIRQGYAQHPTGSLRVVNTGVDESGAQAANEESSRTAPKLVVPQPAVL